MLSLRNPGATKLTAPCWNSGGGCTADGGVAHTHAKDAAIQTRRVGCKPDQARVLRLVLVNPHQICYCWLGCGSPFRTQVTFAILLEPCLWPQSLPEARTPMGSQAVEDSDCLLAGLTLLWLDHPVSVQEALQSWCLQPAKHAIQAELYPALASIPLGERSEQKLCTAAYGVLLSPRCN